MIAGCAFTEEACGLGVVECGFEPTLAYFLENCWGLEVVGLGAAEVVLETVEMVLAAAGDAAGDVELGVGEPSPVVVVRAGGVLAAGGGAVIVAAGKRDIGFCALWQEVFPRTTAPANAMGA